jgi:transposase
MKADIVFIDESGFMMAPVVRRTWALRGRTPIFRRTGRSHRKVSVIAALTVPPRRKRVGLYFSMYSDANITALRVRTFLRHLSRQVQKPLLVVWDRSNTHRAKLMNRYFARAKRMHRDYFPPYAPELNPVEMFWSYLKCNPLANFAAPDLDTLSRSTRYHAGRLRSRKELLRSFLYATPLFSRPI